jgi:ricin-type beta-trefoil lectin protein
MTESHDDQQPDPVLVRPYVKNVPAQSTRDPSDTPTVIQPAIVDEPAEAPASDPRRRRGGGLARALGLRLLALIAGVAVALAVAGYLIFAPKDDTTQPSAVLPEFTAPAVTDPAPASARPSTSASVSPSASSSSPSASASAPPSSAPASPSVSVSATLAPPPGTARSGSITAASGRCLALGGLLGLDGSPVQVSGCAGVASQKFTLATDGTLRVSGRCVEATGEATLRVEGCGDAAGAQWRTGRPGTLINAATGQCLTDPGRAGATATTATCTGKSDQSWTLP